MAVDISKALPFVQAKWKSAPCVVCGNSNKNVEQSVYQLFEFNDGGLALGGPVYPVVPMTCTNCGYVMLLNAVIAGVVTN